MNLIQHMVQQLLGHKKQIMYEDMKSNGNYDTKKCVVCGRKFKPKNGNHNTCGPVCSNTNKNSTRRKRHQDNRK